MYAKIATIVSIKMYIKSMLIILNWVSIIAEMFPGSFLYYLLVSHGFTPLIFRVCAVAMLVSVCPVSVRYSRV